MSRLHWVAIIGILLFFCFLSVFIAKTVPDIRDRIALSECLLASNDNARRECAFSVMRTTLAKHGVAEALHTFVTANTMFQKLDIDCHSGIHRVGDMMYYSIYLANQFDISPNDFPREALMCNLGFYHGVFEHLFQDRPDPKFISDTCNRFPLNGDRRSGAVRYTCFHAAGHGLLRAQSEKISHKDWGNPDAFVTAPVAQCNSLPNASEGERFSCITGVESIFIQTSILKEYGLSDPDGGMTICDGLNTTLHPTCYYVRSLMISQMSNSYTPVIRSCSSATEPLFRECLRGTIAGLAVNGLNENSLNRSLEICNQKEVVQRADSEICFQQVITQIGQEYLGNYVPKCDLFPDAFRSACKQASHQ